MAVIAGAGQLHPPEHEPIPQAGERVLTLTHINWKPVYRLGTHTGQAPYPYSAKEGASPWAPAKGQPNPKIILDDGEVIWGCECWWWHIAETTEGIYVSCGPADRGIMENLRRVGLGKRKDTK